MRGNLPNKNCFADISRRQRLHMSEMGMSHYLYSLFLYYPSKTIAM
jgi:hypothetical protein